MCTHLTTLSSSGWSKVPCDQYEPNAHDEKKRNQWKLGKAGKIWTEIKRPEAFNKWKCYGRVHQEKEVAKESRRVYLPSRSISTLFCLCSEPEGRSVRYTTTGVSCLLASHWVHPMESTSRRLEDRKRVRSGYFFPSPLPAKPHPSLGNEYILQLKAWAPIAWPSLQLQP